MGKHICNSQFIEMFGGTAPGNTFNQVSIESTGVDIFAGGDKPSDYSESRTELYKYPVYANGEKNDGLQCYSKTFRVSKPAITVSARGTIGYSAIREACFTPIVRLITHVPNETINLVYLKHSVDTLKIKSTGSSQGQLTVPDYKRLRIQLPPLPLQNRFAEFVQQVDKSKFAVQRGFIYFAPVLQKCLPLLDGHFFRTSLSPVCDAEVALLAKNKLFTRMKKQGRQGKSYLNCPLLEICYNCLNKKRLG